MVKYNTHENNINENNNRVVSNNRVNDLVTHKQKQIAKRNFQNKILSNRSKNANSDNSSSSNNNDEQFIEQDNCSNESQKVRSIRYQKRIERQNKEKLLESINKLMAKNKINSKTAFDIPILSIDDFAMYDTDEQGQIAWNKLSSIIENGSKIYGIRVQSVQDFLKKISDALSRKDIQLLNQKDKNQNQPQITDNNKQKKSHQKIKTPQFITTEGKVDLTMHLEKNSESIDINLRKKLMMRKDPLFEKTCQRFDYCAFSSFFMNTLGFGKGLILRINASEERFAGKQIQLECNGQQKLKMGDGDTERKERKRNSSVTEQSEHYYRKLINIAQICKISQQFKSINQGLNKIHKNIANWMINGYETYQPLNISQSEENYQQLVNLILQCKFKSVFDSSSIIEDTQQIINHQSDDKQLIKTDNKATRTTKKQIHPPNELQHEKKDTIVIVDQNQMQIEEVEQKQIYQNAQPQNIYQQQQQIKEQVTGKINNKINHKLATTQTKKISDVIHIKDFNGKKQQIRTRNKKLNPLIMNIISSELKQQSIVKQNKSIFDATEKEYFTKVLKKQKVSKNKDKCNQDYLEKNLMQVPVCCGFTTQYPIYLRPVLTAEDEKRQRQQKNKRYFQELDAQNNDIKNSTNELFPKDELIQADVIEHRNRILQERKYPKMQTIKKQIKQIVKQNKKISFKRLLLEYNRKNGMLSAPTLFIAILHVTNEGFIRVIQRNDKNFVIQL